MSEPAAERYVYELYENGSIVVTGRMMLATAAVSGDMLALANGASSCAS